MQFYKQVKLKDGTDCLLRNATKDEAKISFDLFKLTHAQSENLLTYADENIYDEKEQMDFLEKTEKSENEVEIFAFVDGKMIGSAGIEAAGKKDKIKHRAEFGISIEKSYCNKGIGKALTQACIECAEKAGYEQLELDVVSTNEAALALYKSFGFVEFGRNPKGFKTRDGIFQELVLMRLELK